MANKAISLEQMSRIWGKVKIYVAAAISGLYTKPNGGIPKSDLSSEVQTSLGKADSALQSFTESDPTVPSWAKQSSKPTYTAQEVGALPNTTTLADLEDATHKTVTPTEKETWNAKQDALTGYAEETFVFTLADDSTVTKTLLVK